MFNSSLQCSAATSCFVLIISLFRAAFMVMLNADFSGIQVAVINTLPAGPGSSSIPRASARFMRFQTAKLKRKRNRAALSYWPLSQKPS